MSDNKKQGTVKLMDMLSRYPGREKMPHDTVGCLQALVAAARDRLDLERAKYALLRAQDERISELMSTLRAHPLFQDLIKKREQQAREPNDRLLNSLYGKAIGTLEKGPSVWTYQTDLAGLYQRLMHTMAPEVKSVELGPQDHESLSDILDQIQRDEDGEGFNNDSVPVTQFTPAIACGKCALAEAPADHATCQGCIATYKKAGVKLAYRPSAGVGSAAPAKAQGEGHGGRRTGHGKAGAHDWRATCG